MFSSSRAKMNNSVVWTRRGKLLLIPAGIMLFVLLLSLAQPSRDGGKGRASPVYSTQTTYQQYNQRSDSYKIALISDMDVGSKIGDQLEWKGVAIRGSLSRGADGKYKLDLGEEEELRTKYNEEGRGMELSELVSYNGQLLSCDDRTGIIFEIMLDKHIAIPRHVVVDGDGKTSAKGLKCEWMAVKDEKLWMGSIGKEWVSKGVVKSLNNLWVKTLDLNGQLSHVDWTKQYTAIREFTSTQYPGYIVHEAITWSSSTSRWIVLPRRISTLEYDDVEDESRGSNRGFIITEDFGHIKEFTLGENDPTRGFSSVKVVPFRENEIVALKTREYKGTTASYLMVFDIESGEVLLPETQVSAAVKFEGVEFI